MIPKAERGQYDLVGAVRGYVAYLRDLAIKAQPGAPDFGAERARLIKAKADLAEMEAEGRRGELLPADAVEAAWTAVLARLRARLLVLPDRLPRSVTRRRRLPGSATRFERRSARRSTSSPRRRWSPLTLTGPERLATAVRQALAILRPPPELTISAWADANRRLSSEASAEPGQWRTSRAEYQRGIMDAISDGAVEERGGDVLGAGR